MSPRDVDADTHYLDGIMLPALALHALALDGFVRVDGQGSWRWTEAGIFWLSQHRLEGCT